ncbi:tyrosine-type recombinase/integrase [Mycoplasma sp. Z1473D]
MFNKINEFIKYSQKKNLTGKTVLLYKYILENYKDCSTIDEVKKRLINIKMKPQTKKVHKVVLSLYFKHIKKYNYVEEISLIKLESEGQIYRTVLTKEQIENSLKESSYDDDTTRFYKHLFLFMFQTGIRAGEVNSITENGTNLYVKGKGRKTREILYKREVWLMIRKEMLKPNNPLLKYEALRHQLKKIFRKKIGLHTLRRSFATHMLLSGANPKTVQMQMGHSNINTTYAYLNVSKRKNQEEYDKYM